uniref:EC38 protein n=1 Tax=Colletotrichum higginsianum TaxID=80884 RepID=I2G7B7_9PEZI|nr:EC38 protein [Colletotrichum higginsianum]
MQISLKTLYIAAATLMAASSVSADSCSRWNGDKCPDNRPVSCGDGCCCETLNVCAC